MLTGLNQKGKWSGTGASSSPVADVAPPADSARRLLTPGSIEKVNEVTPLSPREGRRPAKEANGTAGKVKREEANAAVVDRIEDESTHGQHSLTAKAS